MLDVAKVLRVLFCSGLYVCLGCCVLPTCPDVMFGTDVISSTDLHAM